MAKIDKKKLSERDICSRYIRPAILRSQWDPDTDIREQVYFTDGQSIPHADGHDRGPRKFADFILSHQNVQLAVVEAKSNKFSVGSGMQQALDYARILDVLFVFSSNGDAFLFHDKTAGPGEPIERQLSLDEFPSPDQLLRKFQTYRGLDDAGLEIVKQDYYTETSGKQPRYYQIIAIDRTIEAITRGQQRILLVMATGTGKTYTAFQIIWRLRKAGLKKRILFLADRNILVDQAKTNDFEPFGQAMTKVAKRTVDKSYEIYLCLYQAVTGTDDEKNIYKQFSPDFFDLVVIDECHRGSANADSAWRQILEYFSSATQLGLTATPKEESNVDYFGKAIYTYSLKQGIEDGFLAPYTVVRIDLDSDEGWRPEPGQFDKWGREIESRVYTAKDMDTNLVIDGRTRAVARVISDFLRATNRRDKTIVFCEDIPHAERIRQALVNENADIIDAEPRYVMRITGDDSVGKAQLDHFIDPEDPYPVIATTSKLLSTGVDARTCKLIVLDLTINSMTEFKQIIGRGTRIFEDPGNEVCPEKLSFTIIDFKGATRLFADEKFDGPPEQIYEPKPGQSPVPPRKRPPKSGLPLDKVGLDHLVGDDEEVVDSRPYEVVGADVKVVGREVQRYNLGGTAAGPATHEEPSENPPRKQRVPAEVASVRRVLDSHAGMARQVLMVLATELEQGRVTETDDPDVLKLPAFAVLGSIKEIFGAFGGRANYQRAAKALAAALDVAAESD